MTRSLAARRSPRVARLALAAMLFQALIPQGFMPATARDAWTGLPIVVCPGSGAAATPAGHLGHDGDTGQKAAHGEGAPCAFAAATGTALLPADGAPALELASATAAPVPLHRTPLTARVSYGPPVRGPPRIL